MTTIKEFIEGTGLKKSHVAALAKITAPELSRILRGMIPSDEDKVRIAAALRECTGKDVTVEMLWPVPAEKVQ